MNRQTFFFTFILIGLSVLLLGAPAVLAGVIAITPASLDQYLVRGTRVEKTIQLQRTEADAKGQVRVVFDNPSGPKSLVRGPASITFKPGDQHVDYSYVIDTARAATGTRQVQIIFQFIPSAEADADAGGQQVIHALAFKLTVHVVEKASDIPVTVELGDRKNKPEDYLKLADLKYDPPQPRPGQEVEYSWRVENKTDKWLADIPYALTVERQGEKVSASNWYVPMTLPPHATTTASRRVTLERAGDYAVAVRSGALELRAAVHVPGWFDAIIKYAPYGALALLAALGTLVAVIIRKRAAAKAHSANRS